MTVEEFKNWCWAIIGGTLLVLLILLAFYSALDAIRDRMIAEIERRANKNHAFLKERVTKLEKEMAEHLPPRKELP